MVVNQVRAPRSPLGTRSTQERVGATLDWMAARMFKQKEAQAVSRHVGERGSDWMVAGPSLCRIFASKSIRGQPQTG
jgi:hypothetical protein